MEAQRLLTEAPPQLTGAPRPPMEAPRLLMEAPRPLMEAPPHRPLLQQAITLVLQQDRQIAPPIPEAAAATTAATTSGTTVGGAASGLNALDVAGLSRLGAGGTVAITGITG